MRELGDETATATTTTGIATFETTNLPAGPRTRTTTGMTGKRTIDALRTSAARARKLEAGAADVTTTTTTTMSDEVETTDSLCGSRMVPPETGPRLPETTSVGIVSRPRDHATAPEAGTHNGASGEVTFASLLRIAIITTTGEIETLPKHLRDVEPTVVPAQTMELAMSAIQTRKDGEDVRRNELTTGVHHPPHSSGNAPLHSSGNAPHPPTSSAVHLHPPTFPIPSV